MHHTYYFTVVLISQTDIRKAIKKLQHATKNISKENLKQTKFKFWKEHFYVF